MRETWLLALWTGRRLTRREGQDADDAVAGDDLFAAVWDLSVLCESARRCGNTGELDKPFSAMRPVRRSTYKLSRTSFSLTSDGPSPECETEEDAGSNTYDVGETYRLSVSCS